MLTYDITNFYYDNDWRVLAEYDGSNNFQRSYIYGNYVDEVLCMIDDTPSIDYYYAHDHLYNVSALIGSAGDAVEYYEYDAYGKVTAITDDGGDGDWWDGDETTATSSAQGNPYYFTGRRLDDLDSHNLLVMYYRHRSYHPKMGRFLQHDPLGYVDGCNMYGYVKDNPFMYMDAYGQSSNSYNLIIKLAKRSIGVVISYARQRMAQELRDRRRAVKSYICENGHSWDKTIPYNVRSIYPGQYIKGKCDVTFGYNWKCKNCRNDCKNNWTTPNLNISKDYKPWPISEAFFRLSGGVENEHVSLEYYYKGEVYKKAWYNFGLKSRTALDCQDNRNQWVETCCGCANLYVTADCDFKLRSGNLGPYAAAAAVAAAYYAAPYITSALAKIAEWAGKTIPKIRIPKPA